MNTKEFGGLGERIACEYLVEKGLKILGKNYRINFGEIDIIAKKKFKLFVKNDKTIHFVEVKTIANLGDGFYPEDRVDYKKQQKLRQLSQIWLSKKGFPQDYPHQIDVIGIVIDKNSNKPEIQYFENVVSGV